MNNTQSLVAAIEEGIRQRIADTDKRIKEIDEQIASVEKLIKEKGKLVYYRNGLEELLSGKTPQITSRDTKSMATAPKRTPVLKTINTIKSILRASPSGTMTVWELHEELRKKGIGCSWRDPANYLSTMLSNDKSFELVSRYNWRLANTSRLSA